VQGRNPRLSPTFPGKTAAPAELSSPQTCQNGQAPARNSRCFEISPVPWRQVPTAMVASMERLAVAEEERYFTAKT
jgi:hypothetical protein